jgi:hypothetical protein
MFSLDVFIIVILTGVFCLGVLNLDFSIFEKTQRALAKTVAEKCGLYDIYFQLSGAQYLEMPRSLRHYEVAFMDGPIDMLSETLSIP